MLPGEELLKKVEKLRKGLIEGALKRVEEVDAAIKELQTGALEKIGEMEAAVKDVEEKIVGVRAGLPQKPEDLRAADEKKIEEMEAAIRKLKVDMQTRKEMVDAAVKQLEGLKKSLESKEK